ncbi:class I SAM-dependent methyltransferase [Truepera radiovictrix]|uniref:Methyltransferase type 11 n=1 Tax=Truepera radiovictrix (strain DSM 17093 / CIP 108686 / LMG 22925 / RQ-24) TaxID=649638 RepID=D7CQ51_TRURR|nr:class I SAM-dependent methyltransferase [Truepera radiovictrix]ADI14835.1 Methyltransferase type 11 [Truepera radiovictrix DSM 17093]WMT56614.1 class I SAM-dependent methyltransferase [Truepera radiovictrix]
MQEALREQYEAAANLDARVALHARFGAAQVNWYRWVFDRVVREAAPPGAARVLELGCGHAKLWRENAERVPEGWDLTLTDASPGMVAAAEATLGATPHPVTFAVAAAQALPFADAAFDAVIANHMLYHVPDLPRALTEVRRVLRPGGTLFAATNGREHLLELDALTRALTPEGVVSAFSRRTHLATFDLETGAAALHPFFADVTLHHAPRSDLYVTEAEPLVAYALSLLPEAPRQDEAKLSAFRQEVARRIAASGGVRITRSSGLFVAR